MKITRAAFDRLIAEDVDWLVKNAPDCLERQHILDVLGCASEAHYGPKDSAPPSNCRERLRAEGKMYPRSSCEACGKWAPKWKECTAALKDSAPRAEGDDALRRKGGPNAE